MSEPPQSRRPVSVWLHTWSLLTVSSTLVLLILGQLVTSFRAGMADPVWPTEPWYLLNNYKLDLGYLIEHIHRVAGFVIGALVTIQAITLWLTDPRKVTRWIGLIGLITLLGAYGEFHRALMAQREPGVEVEVPTKAVNTMFVGLGILAAMAMSGIVTQSRGAGLRLLGLVAMIAVMVQGLLGGFRVKLNELVGTDLAAVHGVFAQVVFCLLVATAELTGRPSSGELSPTSRRQIGRPALTLVSLLFVQLVWGVMVRHNPTPLGQRLHFLTAFLIVGLVVWLLRMGFASAVVRPRVATIGWALATLVGLQVLLGVEAWMGKFGTYTLPELVPVTKSGAAIRTAHVLVGTGVLASALLFAIRVWRPARPPEHPPTSDASQAGDIS